MGNKKANQTKAIDIQLFFSLLSASLKHIKLYKVIVITTIVNFVTQIDIIYITMMLQKQEKKNRTI